MSAASNNEKITKKGGKGKIHEHPNAGINNFKQRPKEAGRLPSIKTALLKILKEDGSGLNAILEAGNNKALQGDTKSA